MAGQDGRRVVRETQAGGGGDKPNNALVLGGGDTTFFDNLWCCVLRSSRSRRSCCSCRTRLIRIFLESLSHSAHTDEAGRPLFAMYHAPTSVGGGGGIAGTGACICCICCAIARAACICCTACSCSTSAASACESAMALRSWLASAKARGLKRRLSPRVRLLWPPPRTCRQCPSPLLILLLPKGVE